VTPASNVIALPASFEEAAMLAFARDWIAVVRNVDLLGVADSFNTEAAHRMVRRMTAVMAEEHPRNAARLVDLALAGAEDVHQGLLDLIAEKNAAHVPLPAALATYATIINDRGPPVPRRPSCRPRDEFLANFVICCLLIAIQRRFPLLKFRRSSRRKLSACSIVADVLIEAGIGRGSEEAIRMIWERYGPPVVPGYGWKPGL
jgi:hypothetical protein